MCQQWEDCIKFFEAKEQDMDAKKAQLNSKGLLKKATEDLHELTIFQRQVEIDWSNKESQILGHVVYSPAVTPGVGKQQFMQDWAIFEINPNKLGDGFRGNQINLGTEIPKDKFKAKCSPYLKGNWKFKYPKDRLLCIHGILSNQEMHTPTMTDKDGQPCLLVVKQGITTNTTLGRANGVFSVHHWYKCDGVSVEGTSLEWCIIGYNSKLGQFSDTGDSGSAIVCIDGHMGGKLSGGSSSITKTSNTTYATPFWWDLERIQANGFPHAHIA